MGISNTCQVPSARPLVLSGADSRYFRCLWQFLCSAERKRLSGACAWRIYDLGLHQSQLQSLRQRFQWCEFTKFEFDRYPEHVSMEARSYAWKPVIIADNLTSWDAPVFWFDSATVLHTALELPLATVARNGIWALKSKSPLQTKCDPRVLDALEVPLAVRHLPERAAGALGFDPGHAAAVKLAMDWKRYALNRSLVVPDGAPVYHKQDQSLFNCLLLKAADEGGITLTDDEIDISSARPARDITTRNILSPSIPLWADPLARLWYGAYKKADQFGHRWNEFSSSRLDGAHRWWKEHFTVSVCDVSRGMTRSIPSPRYSYYADPFLWRHGGSNWLFMEEYQYAKAVGRLVVLELNDALEPGSPRPLRSTSPSGHIDCHASFPHLFEMNGLTCMIPETSERRSVDLYVCEQWPDRWNLVRRLLFDLDAADTMTLRHDGLWWLITSVRSEEKHRHLEIFFTDDLIRGTLTPHPENVMRRYEDTRYGTGRNAGYLAKSAEGRIMRLMQNSRRYYGEGVSAMEVVELTPRHFVERAVAGIDALPMVSKTFSTHHVSLAGNLLAYDTRDRVR